MMKKRGDKSLILIGMFLLAFALFVNAISFTPNEVFYLNEDNFFSYNFTQNTTYDSSDIPLVFAIDTENNINSSNPLHFGFSLDDFYWLYFSSSNQGIFDVNAINDNETGSILVPLQVTTKDGSGSFSGDQVTFKINATNDVPIFLNLESFYSLDEPGQSYTVNAYDEEEHFPLSFNMTFFNNCTHSLNSIYEDGENCSLFNYTILNDSAFFIEYIYDTLDVGNYWANFTMQESTHLCPHEYCLENYTQNWTVSQIVHFIVPYTLGMDSSDCEESIFVEGQETNCTLEFFTYGENDLLNISSYGFFTNYFGAIPEDRSWFFPSIQTQTSYFVKEINVSLTPTKSQVGNWSINFSLFDVSNSDFASKVVPINVDYVESLISFGVVENLTQDVAIYRDTSFNIVAYDDDLKIRDKSLKNERITLSSNVSWVSFGSGVTLVGNNFTNFSATVDYDELIEFGVGNYSCLITGKDLVLNEDSFVFVVEILDDTPAVWNQTFYSYSLFEDDSFYLNISDFVNDSEYDPITFLLDSSNPFPSFNLSSLGIIQFTPNKSDVGNHSFSINAFDGKLDSLGSFNFYIENINDAPIIYQINTQNATPTSGINNGDDIFMEEGKDVSFFIYVQDDDFLIPLTGKDIYNESISISTNFTNTSVVEEILEISFDSGSDLSGNPNKKLFTSNFMAERENVGNYSLNITITDASNESDSILLNIVIEEINYPPVLSFVSNQSYTILDEISYDINATDREDSLSLPESGLLTYSLFNLSVGGDFLEIDSATGVLNASLNSTYAGEWLYNVSVSDSQGLLDSHIFSIKVYNYPNVFDSSLNSQYTFAENSSFSFSFNFSYEINNTNFTYFIYLNNVSYIDNSYVYSDLDDGLKVNSTFNFMNISNEILEWDSFFGYQDESYGKFRNLSLIVYPNGFDEVSSTFNWEFNVTHKNQNLSFYNDIPDYSGVKARSSFSVDLLEHFLDVDYLDEYYNQVVNFSLNCSSGSYICPGSSFNNWTLYLYSPVAVNENISVIGYEFLGNNLITSVSSNVFNVQFEEPEVVEVVTTRTTTKTKQASFQIVLPYETFVLSEDSLEIPFYIQNTGEVDISNLVMNSSVFFSDILSDSIEVSLNESSFSKLGISQRINNSLILSKNFEKPGKYKIILWGNSSSPKVSHSVEFYVEIREKVLEDLEKLLIFTEKFILENPQCLELQESIQEAYSLYEKGNTKEALELANSTVSLCEEFISKNEQIRRVFYILGDKFYILMILTLCVFLFSFFFYIYKRKRFKNTYVLEDLNKRGFA